MSHTLHPKVNIYQLKSITLKKKILSLVQNSYEIPFEAIYLKKKTEAVGNRTNIINVDKIKYVGSKGNLPM